MNVTDFKKEDFQNLRRFEWDEDIGEFNSIVIIPQEDLHDSGFLCMAFVPLDKTGKPLGIISGWSDVVHLDGIGGFGERNSAQWPSRLLEAKSWTIDCLPCGYLRLFARGQMTAGHALSSFEVFAK